MTAPETISKDIRALLESASTVNLHQYPIAVEVRGATLVLEGDVPDIIAKRRIPKLAATVAGVQDVLDRLRVIPSERRGDGAILDTVYDALVQEPVFHGYTIIAHLANEPVASTPPQDNELGLIEVTVGEGVVSLSGHVQSLTHKRLADVLAWWTIGSVDVDNRLRIVPPEQDNDDEITDALRIVLEKDPWLDAGQILVHTRNQCVTLEGLVHSQEQRHMAECDAWSILGVHDVVNRIQVRP